MLWNIIASVILMFSMMRRLSVKFARPEHYPAVEPTRFVDWRERALDAYAFVAWACAGEVVLSLSWGYLASDYVSRTVLLVVALAVVAIWVFLIVAGWRRVTDLRADGRELGIEIGLTRPPK
jgi:hypothetical protein